MENDLVTNGGIMVLALGLVEVIKQLVTKISAKNKSFLTEKERIALYTLLEKDTNGYPLIYTPRDFCIDIKAIEVVLAKIANTQGKTVYILEELNRRKDPR